MASLLNTANANGTIDGVDTPLSGAVTIQTVEGLTLEKTADQLSWAEGDLTYTLTITNAADNPTYTGITITDVLDPTIVFVDGSVTIGGAPAAAADYRFDAPTNTLTIGIDPLNPIDVAGGASLAITFQVRKVTTP